MAIQMVYYGQKVEGTGRGYRPLTVGRRHEVEVTCETRPVGEEHYLHRLRKTAAINWLRSGFDLMKIKSWLGHKSLEVTQIYLDAEMHDPEEQKKLGRAGKFGPEDYTSRREFARARQAIDIRAVGSILTAAISLLVFFGGLAKTARQQKAALRTASASK